MLPVPGRAPEDGEEPKPAGKNQRGCLSSCIKSLVDSKGTNNLIRETNAFDSDKVQNQFRGAEVLVGGECRDESTKGSE